MSVSPRRRAACAVALALVLAACGDVDEPTPYAGVVRDPPPNVGNASLPDASAEDAPFPFRAEGGKVLLLYFGYTSCPDICPTTMSDLRAVLRQLGSDAADVTVAMATIDPHRDSGPRLAEYVHGFIENGHALRTDDDDALRRAADAFGATYSVTRGIGGRIEVSHTAFVYAIDDQGLVRVTWPFGTAPGDIAADLRLLLDAA